MDKVKKALKVEELEKRVAPILVSAPAPEPTPDPGGGGGPSDPIITPDPGPKHSNPGQLRKVYTQFMPSK